MNISSTMLYIDSLSCGYFETNFVLSITHKSPSSHIVAHTYSETNIKLGQIRFYKRNEHVFLPICTKNKSSNPKTYFTAVHFCIKDGKPQIARFGDKFQVHAKVIVWLDLQQWSWNHLHLAQCHL